MVELETQCLLYMLLFMRRHGVVEELYLLEVLLEFRLIEMLHAAIHDRAGLFVGIILLLESGRQRVFVVVWPVVDFTPVDAVVHGTITVEIHDWTTLSVNGKLLPVDAKTADLRVKIQKVASLQK